LQFHYLKVDSLERKGKSDMAGQAKHKLGTMSSGSYDKSAHNGAGKGQKSLSATAGAGRNSSTPHTGNAIVRDGVEGHGGPNRGYQMDAHSGSYHGKHGEAVGHKNDNAPMNYSASLYGEGRPTSESGAGPTFVDKHDHGTPGTKTATHPLGYSTKAEHHPPLAGKAHVFNTMSSRSAHGFGHSPSQCCGPLRMSGHARGHRLGMK
jgi:hypothetical protein